LSATLDLYLQRAAENARAAQETNLINVRERCLRAEAAWQAMADRLTQVEAQKKRDALEKSISAGDKLDEVPWPVAPYRPQPRQKADHPIGGRSYPRAKSSS
jgi:hypothetical protein